MRLSASVTVVTIVAAVSRGLSRNMHGTPRPRAARQRARASVSDPSIEAALTGSTARKVPAPMWRPVVLWAPARCLSFLVRPVVFKTLLGEIFDRRSLRLLGYRVAAAAVASKSWRSDVGITNSWQVGYQNSREDAQCPTRFIEERMVHFQGAKYVSITLDMPAENEQAVYRGAAAPRRDMRFKFSGTYTSFVNPRPQDTSTRARTRRSNGDDISMTNGAQFAAARPTYAVGHPACRLRPAGVALGPIGSREAGQCLGTGSVAAGIPPPGLACVTGGIQESDWARIHKLLSWNIVFTPAVKQYSSSIGQAYPCPDGVPCSTVVDQKLCRVPQWPTERRISLITQCTHTRPPPLRASTMTERRSNKCAGQESAECGKASVGFRRSCPSVRGAVKEGTKAGSREGVPHRAHSGSMGWIWSNARAGRRRRITRAHAVGSLRQAAGRARPIVVWRMAYTVLRDGSGWELILGGLCEGLDGVLRCFGVVLVSFSKSPRSALIVARDADHLTNGRKSIDYCRSLIAGSVDSIWLNGLWTSVDQIQGLPVSDKTGSVDACRTITPRCPTLARHHGILLQVHMRKYGHRRSPSQVTTTIGSRSHGRFGRLVKQNSSSSWRPTRTDRSAPSNSNSISQVLARDLRRSHASRGLKHSVRSTRPGRLGVLDALFGMLLAGIVARRLISVKRNVSARQPPRQTTEGRAVHSPSRNLYILKFRQRQPRCMSIAYSSRRRELGLADVAVDVQRRRAGPHGCSSRPITSVRNDLHDETRQPGLPQWAPMTHARRARGGSAVRAVAVSGQPSDVLDVSRAGSCEQKSSGAGEGREIRESWEGRARGVTYRWLIRGATASGRSGALDRWWCHPPAESRISIAAGGHLERWRHAPLDLVRSPSVVGKTDTADAEADPSVHVSGLTQTGRADYMLSWGIYVGCALFQKVGQRTKALLRNSTKWPLEARVVYQAGLPFASAVVIGRGDFVRERLLLLACKRTGSAGALTWSAITNGFHVAHVLRRRRRSSALHADRGGQARPVFAIPASTATAGIVVDRGSGIPAVYLAATLGASKG
ncbi:hypothetical protein C8Q70DRAFT_934574 [Cubamyces menziesii]|nr:hypothetical protein C8Q70DRAFT_934574 [Cubamyces menziesii]